ncbi:MAG: hypothetical protein AAFY84_04690 [Pseudomonadota bacterium]
MEKFLAAASIAALCLVSACSDSTAVAQTTPTADAGDMPPASMDDDTTGADAAVTPLVQSGLGLNISALPFVPAPSGGTLLREEDRVRFSGSYSSLSAESVYSAWWLIANEPQNCQFDCGLEDIAAGVVQVFNAGGFLTDANGAATVSFALPAGEIPTGADRFSANNDFALMIDPATEVGLQAPMGALIAVIARNHGPIDLTPDVDGDVDPNLANRLGRYTGGCNMYELPGDGVFDCFDEQSILFAPPAPAE